MKQDEKLYFKRGKIKVTKRSLRTRFKDESLAPIQSVQIGREPLLIAGVIAVGLLAFAKRFGSLLFWHEQLALFGIGAALAILGYSFASLKIGQLMQERTVLWHTIWTIEAVREAIDEARNDVEETGPISAVILEGGE